MSDKKASKLSNLFGGSSEEENNTESMPLKRKSSIPKLLSSSSSKRKLSKTPETSPRTETPDYSGLLEAAETTTTTTTNGDKKHHHSSSSKKQLVTTLYASKKQLLQMQVDSLKQIQCQHEQIEKLQKENVILNNRIDMLDRRISDLRNLFNQQQLQPSSSYMEQEGDRSSTSCFTEWF